MNVDIDALYKRIKNKDFENGGSYDEEQHCKLLLKIMTDKNKGTFSAFCCEALIDEMTFWRWVKTHPMFGIIWSIGYMFSREVWEDYGKEIRDLFLPPGATSYAFEYWKMMGWARFGIGKTNRIRLELEAKDTPDKHYSQLLKQASTGIFTAGEIKQLMEAINVGLNTHQVFQLQEEINQLKSDLATMVMNSDVKNNSFADKGITKKD